jgi:hypothetical protein
MSALSAFITLNPLWATPSLNQGNNRQVVLREGYEVFNCSLSLLLKRDEPFGRRGVRGHEPGLV